MRKKRRRGRRIRKEQIQGFGIRRKRRRGMEDKQKKRTFLFTKIFFRRREKWGYNEKDGVLKGKMVRKEEGEGEEKRGEERQSGDGGMGEREAGYEIKGYSGGRGEGCNLICFHLTVNGHPPPPTPAPSSSSLYLLMNSIYSYICQRDSLTRISTYVVFHQTSPPGFLYHTLILQICRDIRIEVDSAMSIKLLSNKKFPS
jgi:hypothetical protein